MQTIKVNTTTKDGNAFFSIDGKDIARTYSDWYNKGRFAGQFGPFASCNNKGFADAVEFISDAIENHFAAFGLNVEFVNA
jgi:hypothetical protein